MTIDHASFTVTRDFQHPIENVFHAFADEATKQQWVAEKSNTAHEGFRLDFRVDGRESSAFRLPDAAHLPPEVRGQRITNESVIQDIVVNERIVYAYRMTIGGAVMSVSLATVQFAATAAGTRVTYTEQGAYFRNADGAAMREGGWKDLLAKLGALLDRQSE